MLDTKVSIFGSRWNRYHDANHMTNKGLTLYAYGVKNQAVVSTIAEAVRWRVPDVSCLGTKSVSRQRVRPSANGYLSRWD